MSREKVLSAIRSRFEVSGSDQTRQVSVDARLTQQAANTIPAIGRLTGAARLEQFIRSSEQKGAQVFQVEDLGAAAAQILSTLPANSHFAVTTAAKNTGIPLPATHSDHWQAKTSLENCISTCFCGVAETGSLAVMSGEENALTQNFLADRHFVLLPEADILDCMESVWLRLRETGGMPRDLTLVSGPSSTGDIEMQMERGAHGPRELYILAIKDQ
tara:strand:- start:24 stop:671 length:648 start_codon:yes stop_codon:yes gene_type:complete